MEFFFPLFSHIASGVWLTSYLAVQPLKEKHLKQKTILKSKKLTKKSKLLEGKIVKIFSANWKEVLRKVRKFKFSWNHFKAIIGSSYRSKSSFFSTLLWHLVNFLTNNSSTLSTTTIVVWIVVVVIIVIVVIVLVVIDNVDVVAEACARDHDVDHGGEHEGEADVDHEGAEGEEGEDAGVAAAAKLNHLKLENMKCEFKIRKSSDTFFRVFFFFFFFLWP